MQPTKLRRWTKGPHDRIYVSTNPSGTDRPIDIGWFDLRTRRHQLLVPGMMAEFDAAITWWLHLPKGQHTPAPAPVDIGRDLAATSAGATLRRRAEQLRPGLAVRAFARITGRRTPDQSWTIGEQGEKAVAAKLDKLTRHGWKVLHSIDTGAGDIDHLLIGPRGVFVISTKHHPDADIDVTADAITVNRRRTSYTAQVTRETGLARAALAAALGRPIYVAPLIVVYGHHSITGWKNHAPAGVRVLPFWAIRWWVRLPGRTIHSSADIDQIFAAARNSATWQGAPERSPRPIRTPDTTAAAGTAHADVPAAPAQVWPSARWAPGPTDPRSDEWRALLSVGDPDQLLNAAEIASELHLTESDLSRLIDVSRPYWTNQRTGRPSLPQPSIYGPDFQDAEWFRAALAVHFGAEPVPLHLLRPAFDD